MFDQIAKALAKVESVNGERVKSIAMSPSTYADWLAELGGNGLIMATVPCHTDPCLPHGYVQFVFAEREDA